MSTRAILSQVRQGGACGHLDVVPTSRGRPGAVTRLDGVVDPADLGHAAGQPPGLHDAQVPDEGARRAFADPKMEGSCKALSLAHVAIARYRLLLAEHSEFAVAYSQEGVLLAQELSWMRSHRSTGCRPRQWGTRGVAYELVITQCAGRLARNRW